MCHIVSPSKRSFKAMQLFGIIFNRSKKISGQQSTSFQTSEKDIFFKTNRVNRLTFRPFCKVSSAQGKTETGRL